MSALLEAALDYARRGWSVFPLVAGGKVPNGRLAPNGCKNATTSEVVIRAWWAEAPDANIGVATGEGSGLLVVDIDPGAGGRETMDALAAEHGRFPLSVASTTGGGGHHLWYAYPPVGRFGNTAGKIGVGIDTRGEGGYVVAPPSETADAYRWVEPSPAFPLADAPAWLLDLLTDKPAERPARASAPATGSAYADKALVDELERVVMAAPGSRNSTLNRAAFSLGQLVGGGLLDHAVVERMLVNAGLNAGLSESESAATVRSGMTAGQRDPRTAPGRTMERTFDSFPVASNVAVVRADGEEWVEVAPNIILADRQAATGSTDGLVSLADALGGYLDAAEKARQGGTGGVPTGFADADRLLGGLRGGELVILAARPGQGKTAMALNIVRHAAGERVPVLVFSAEMSCHQLAERLLASEAHVDAKRLREGYVDAAEHARVNEAFEALSTLPVWIKDESSPTLGDLIATARRAVRERAVGLIVLDYVGLVRVPGQREPRLQVREVSRDLKALARDANVPVLALSQLNRAVEGRADHTPMLSDLRESGDLEQDSDVVMFLSREEAFNPNTDRRAIADLTIAKNRSGPTGACPLRWIASEVRFADLSPYSPGGYDQDGESF